MADNYSPQTGSDPEFRRSSFWQGFLYSSIEPASVLAFVKRAVTGHAPPPARNEVVQGLCPLADIKKHLAVVLDDCPDDAVRMRIAGRISTAATVTELWLMRCDIYQCVAREKGQAEAARRINKLLPVFEGWLPARQLTAV